MCDLGYFPNENGGCSYTDHYEMSEKGDCIKCQEDYILTGKKLYNNYLFVNH